MNILRKCALLLFLSGCCVMPGSGLATYRIHGRVLDATTHRPIAGAHVTVFLPKEIGVGRNETADAVGNQDQIRKVMTDAEGRYAAEFKVVFHISIHVLGPSRAQPPPPDGLIVGAEQAGYAPGWFRLKYSGDATLYQELLVQNLIERNVSVKRTEPVSLATEAPLTFTWPDISLQPNR